MPAQAELILFEVTVLPVPAPGHVSSRWMPDSSEPLIVLPVWMRSGTHIDGSPGRSSVQSLLNGRKRSLFRLAITYRDSLCEQRRGGYYETGRQDPSRYAHSYSS
jgi:hypothetical protein